MNKSIKKMNNNFYVYNLTNNDLQQQKRFINSSLQQIEMKQQLISMHEIYLQLDDKDQRDEYRKKLHKCTVDYLLKIAHQNKFILPDFDYLFNKCIATNSSFEPLKAAESFDTLFIITNNLILKPWRKEFQKINIYNAYFKHLLDNQIPHYHHILKLIGYESKNKNGITNYNLIKRVNLEMLKLVSFDCFICYVELRYFYQFGEILKSKNIKPNWSFILELRKRHTGDFETTLDNYLLFYQDQIEFKAENVVSKNAKKNEQAINEEQMQINKKYKHLSNLISQYEQQDENLIVDEKPMNRNLIDLGSLDSIRPPQISSYDNLEQLLNSSFDNLQFNHNINLINSQSTIANYQQQPTTTYNHQPINNNNHLNLSNNNYTSLLKQESGLKAKEQLTFKETDLDQVDFIDDDELTLKNFENEYDFSSKIKCLNNNAQKLELAIGEDSSTSFTNGEGKIKSNSLEKRSKVNKSVEKKYSTLGNEKKSSKVQKPSILSSINKKKDDGHQKQWSCKHCTMINSQQDEICRMCSKSMRSLPNNKKDELTLLGKECDLCTLVNKKDVSACVACGNSLKNSPTYI